MRFTARTRSHVAALDVGEGLEHVEAGARHHDLDRSELVAHGAERFVDGTAIRDIDLGREGPGAAGPQVIGGLRGGVAVEIEHRDAMPETREAPAHRQPHPRRATGHDCDSAALTLAHAPPSTPRPGAIRADPTGGPPVSMVQHPNWVQDRSRKTRT